MAHPDDPTRDRIEALLVQQAQGHSARILGAATGLESLIRRNTKRPISDRTRERLRQLVLIGPRAIPGPTVAGFGSVEVPGEEANWARTRRLALAALNAANDEDVVTLQQASFDADWQVRRLVAQRINLQMPALEGIASVLAKDTSLQVRYELLNAVSRHATATKTCAPLVQQFADPELKIVLRAIDLLSASCTDLNAAVEPLVKWAEVFRLPEGATRWHLPSRALAALARIAPDSAKPLMSYAVEHPVWQVRAMAATESGRMRDEETVVRLARDLHPNVRNAAIEALFRMKSAAVTAEATEALKSDDYQLVRTAAIRLSGTPNDLRDEVSAALLQALHRLTREGTDTSRDTRVAILERLQEVLAPDRAGQLLAFGDDADPVVRDRAETSLAGLLPGATLAGTPRLRYPYQPPVELVASLPSRAAIFMDDGGTLELELFIDEAPVTTARFVELVQTGYYNGLTFHRVEPNFVIQGGSPGANEYAGVSRYMRDETGGHHLYGTVGISTRGRDTGDAQIFINLVDNPRLDHQYTVFARVVIGLDVLDRILEGAKIKTIALK
jgi:cyclophilin family peptidyl-prolyl cis-trans isomerase